MAEELNRVASLGLPVDGWRVRYWFEEELMVRVRTQARFELSRQQRQATSATESAHSASGKDGCAARATRNQDARNHSPRARNDRSTEQKEAQNEAPVADPEPEPEHKEEA